MAEHHTLSPGYAELQVREVECGAEVARLIATSGQVIAEGEPVRGEDGEAWVELEDGTIWSVADREEVARG